MKTTPQVIFNEFKEKILSSDYHPSSPVETLKARLTATWLLQQDDINVVKQAEEFIKKTSIFKEADLSRLQQLALQIKTWDQFQIFSSYTNNEGNFLEYKLTFTTLDQSQKTLHFHACYQTKNQSCHFVSQFSPLIRIIGDPILHQPGIPFPQNPSFSGQQELEQQIEHAKSILIKTGGAGIAANQCAKIEHPYRFTIVGVFYDSQEHVEGVSRRYPQVKFPAARIMVNPEILAATTEMQQFNHGCLSVPCPNRCEVKSPKEITVSYQDPTQTMATVKVNFKNVDAVVLWHELTHILEGKTYMDIILALLAIEDLYLFQKLLIEELQNRRMNSSTFLPELTIPPFYFTVKINDAGIPIVDQHELVKVLTKMTDETLLGLSNQVKHLLKKNDLLHPKIYSTDFTGLFNNKDIQNLNKIEGSMGLSKL